MEFGLSNEDISFIVSSINGFNEIDKAVIFGSREKGNYKGGSDIVWRQH